MPPENKPELKFKQLVTGQYANADGRIQNVLYGLSESGRVYQHDFAKGWIPIRRAGTGELISKPKRNATSFNSRPPTRSTTVEDDDIPFKTNENYKTARSLKPCTPT